VAEFRTPVIGLQLPTVDGFRQGCPDLRPVAQQAEQLGFDSLWVGDHLVANAPILESVVALTTVAAVTERVHLGFGVMLAALRHPAWIAKQVTSLQVVSGDRVELGIGVGGEIVSEWEVVDSPHSERGRRTDVILDALPRLLTGSEAKVAEPWNVTVPPLEPHGAMPPLWIGGRSEAALRRAVRHGAGYTAVWTDEDRLRRVKEQLVEIAAESGRPVPRIGVQVLVHPSEDGAFGEAETAAFMEQVYRIPFAKLGRWAMSGGRDVIAARLAALVDAGAESVVLIPALRDYLPHMEALGDIADELRARTAP
jgi:alkanesulfonate monooxygenase SsuD/methylene tetrahydromethanopterin reductase-like flavin-dependent oxidoreductase (luciferase family)